ncbi:spore gernimation protein GerB [Bacillus salipaludis]|uniref:Spore gernimation protein GerB n=1 Tax=Bacillus salipaludis TaxID=2547811 RepID=A0A4R5VR04_9BACI|nr:GerAB/ArcD/ProY family transporter [Bacillus salipaludis]TDK60975.1 spore gernimation protein GerB [Bacillus salipaludis]
MEQSVPEHVKISPFLVFFLVHSMQFGVGTLGFQRYIAQIAGYDAWISVLIAGLSIHILVWMLYKIMETVNGDILTAHSFVYGKKIGKLLSIPYVLYFIMIAITTLRIFIEVIQVWMFDDFSTFWFSLAFCGLAIYIVFGGFRTVTGVAFFGVVLPAYLFFTFLFTVPYGDMRNLLPIFDHSIMDLMKASYQMSLTYLGYEILFFVYPFIKQPDKSKKWAHLAVLFSTILYTILTFITFSYFSEGQLQKNRWATLTMWKIIEMPFVERFEYIGIANWLILILPNFCIAIWCASRIVKKVVNLKQKYGVFIISLIILISINFFKTRQQIYMVANFTGSISFFMNYGYIPILLFLVLLKKKVKKK